MSENDPRLYYYLPWLPLAMLQQIGLFLFVSMTPTRSVLTINSAFLHNDQARVNAP